ncbi:hypothetical protein NMY22_g19376 [Coprinellus aureogranulatus]|nr:hypothetical protein NMY22_g19376 [Coprinellus aureogranulatus]
MDHLDSSALRITGNGNIFLCELDSLAYPCDFVPIEAGDANPESHDDLSHLCCPVLTPEELRLLEEAYIDYGVYDEHDTAMEE